MRRARRIYVNEAFRPQRVSGQQRYAREIGDRLPGDFVRLAPSGFWTKSKLHTWLWVQTILPLRSWRGVLISMTARAPIWHPRQLLVIHDLFVLENPEWFSKVYHRTHAPLQRFQMATARAIVAVSEPVARQIRSLRADLHVGVAPNAPSSVFSQASPADEAVLASRGLQRGRYFVTVGSIEPRKNLLRLAEAYGALSAEQRASMPLIVVGGTADIYRDAAVNWPDGVQLAGYVDDDELRALYGGSAAVVFVSLAEGFGLPIVEAAVSGTARLIVSDIEVFRWICGDAATYVDPMSAESIRTALAAIAENPVSTGTVDVSRFTWEASAAVLEKRARSLSRRSARTAAGHESPAPGTKEPRASMAENGQQTESGQVAVILASAGRPALLAETIADLGRQTMRHTLVVSVPDDASLPPGGVPDGTTVVYARGLTAQRNAGLAAVPDAGFIFFFDDDAVVREDFLAQGVAFFNRHPDVVGITGRVLLDGAAGEEIPRSEADLALAESAKVAPSRRWAPSRELYGCNFAYRPAHAGGELFDDRLPLYSWLEDHDFARRLMRHGRLAKVEDCVIVHRGVKSGGRVAHTRLGYSQMMNPLYLHHVGSFPAWLAFREIVPRCGKNLVFSVAGPEASWRRERAKGNLIALRDALLRRFTPERMLEFSHDGVDGRAR